MLSVDSIWFYVRSLAVAREFYGDILELQPIFEDPNSGWVEFATSSDGCRIACQEWGKTAESLDRTRRPPTAPITPRLVLATADLARVIERLAIHGVPVASPQQVGRVRFVNLTDPDGNALQVVEKARSR